MYKNLLLILIALIISSISLQKAFASSSKLLQQGIPVDIIEIDKEAIRSKSQNFQPKRLVIESKNQKIKRKHKK